MQNSVFRKTSLERISSPEQLNEYIRIANPSIWVVLAGLVVIMLSAGAWSVFGNIPDTVRAKGIVFPQNGVVEVMPVAEGRISDIRVKEGNFVQMGQIIAVVPQDNLIKQINEIKSKSTGDSREIDSLVSEYEDKSVIFSPVSGVIISVMKTGENTSPDKPVASIIRQEKYANDRQVICYIPAVVAKKLAVGMEVQVSPDFAPREEYGYMLGTISSIGNYPVTSAEVNSALGGMQSAGSLLPQDSSIEVRITLTIDPDSADMIKWSGKKGEKIQVSIGTSCDILVVVKRQRPLEFIFGGSQGD